MALDIGKAKRIDMVPCGKNQVRMYVFDCLGECGSEVRTNKGYAPKHSGKCKQCSHKSLRPYEAAYNNLLGQQARKEGHRYPVTITFEEFVILAKVPSCYYCQRRINRSAQKGEKGYRGYFLDRKDNSQGYSSGNVVPCCWECNQLKGNRFSHDEFCALMPIIQKSRDWKNRDVVIPHNADAERTCFLSANGLFED